MSRDIPEAKRRLPLPGLMAQLGLGEHAKKSARCPFHKDERNSFSIWQTPNGWWRWKCFTGCGTGDEINFLESHELLSRRDAIRRFLQMAGVNRATRRSTRPSFDWQRCVDALKAEDLVRLGNQRWYSRSFCSRLHDQKLIGMCHGKFAFPVHDDGKVVAAHVRNDDGSWFYTPKGKKIAPLVIGDLAEATEVHCSESTLDTCSVADRTDLYQIGNVAFVVTRGKANARLLADLPLRADATVYVWPQNDEPGRKWLADVCKVVTSARIVNTPSRFKDVNEWAKVAPDTDAGGAYKQNLLRVIAEAVSPVNALNNAQAPGAETKIDNDDEAALTRLAALPLLEYERVREAEAKKLGCRSSILDKLVAEKRPPSIFGDTLQGQIMEMPDVEPWPTSVNGAEVLDEIATVFAGYIALPEGAVNALALWCAHTHAIKVFQCSPRLHITSPEKGCGKTTARDVISTFVPRALATENLTVAVLFRSVDKHQPTLLADECDSWMRDNEELRGLLNSGHRRGGKAFRCEGELNEVRGFNVFCAAVLCGIGALPGTLHDRSIIIRLERAKRGELKARFDSRHVEREHELCRKLSRWCNDNLVRLAAIDPNLPDGAFNRVADNWRPLFAIAEVAGGDWPRRCGDAFAKLTSRECDADSLRVELLGDIRQVFAVERMFSKDLIEHLARLAERPWPEVCRGKPITERWLARSLAAFGIHSKTLRIGDERAKGYELSDFGETFERYLRPEEGDFIRDSVTYEGKPPFSIRDKPANVTDAKSPRTEGMSPCHGCEAGTTATKGYEHSERTHRTNQRDKGRSEQAERAEIHGTAQLRSHALQCGEARSACGGRNRTGRSGDIS